MRLRLKHPESKGGQALKLKEVVDGQYDVLIKRNNSTYAAFRFRVKGGKPMWHPRQASDFKPRTQYIVPRFPGILGTHGDASAGNMFWMERLSDADAATVASSTPSAKTVSKEDRARWEWLPRSIDPNRPFKLAVTEIETRNDTGIAAGEDLIVFGTGFPTGVNYMKVGDTEPREIPGGGTYNSKVFGVCGSKIVLVKKTQLVIFDTKTNKLTAIPETDVSLYNVGQQLLATNGFLIGTANRATAVTDRTIIKVLDVSGDVPKIIPIKNADYLDSEVTSVSVDAKRGTLAISVRQKKLIAAAKIAPLANQYVFDLREYRGVGPQQIFIEGDWVTYADEDWKVRLLDLEKGTPKAITDQAFPRSGNGFFVRNGRLAVATTAEKVGSRYRFAIGDLAESPTIIAGTGTSIEGTSGGLGMGGSAALATDKTVFIAGTPGDSIGVGEHLQVFDGHQWIAILGADGKAIAASEVTTSVGLLAFKSLNSSGKTVIGYATYGQRVNYESTSPAAATTNMATKKTKSGPLKPIKFETENIYNTKDEMDEAVLAAMLENEATMLTAFSQAFGEEAAKKRVVEQVVTAFKAQKQERLIDEYKRRSKCVAEKDKPKAMATATSSDADTRSVEAALFGQWRLQRFVASGQELPDEMIEAVRLTFAKGKYVMVMGGDIETGTYAINTSVLPHQIKISIGVGKNAGQVRHGVFKFLKGNQLLAAYATNDTDQPTHFTSTESNKQLLAGYKRVD
ncbi:MAG: TIGR03067 domain-containing protein [Fuerstiella sp.]